MNRSWLYVMTSTVTRSPWLLATKPNSVLHPSTLTTGTTVSGGRIQQSYCLGTYSSHDAVLKTVSRPGGEPAMWHTHGPVPSFSWHRAAIHCSLFHVYKHCTLDKILKFPIPRNTRVNVVSPGEQQQLVEFAHELTASISHHCNILNAAHGRVKVRHRLTQLVINVERTRGTRLAPINLACEPSRPASGQHLRGICAACRYLKLY